MKKYFLGMALSQAMAMNIDYSFPTLFNKTQTSGIQIIDTSALQNAFDFSVGFRNSSLISQSNQESAIEFDSTIVPMSVSLSGHNQFFSYSFLSSMTESTVKNNMSTDSTHTNEISFVPSIAWLYEQLFFVGMAYHYSLVTPSESNDQNLSYFTLNAGINRESMTYVLGFDFLNRLEIDSTYPNSGSASESLPSKISLGVWNSQGDFNPGIQIDLVLPASHLGPTPEITNHWKWGWGLCPFFKINPFRKVFVNGSLNYQSTAFTESIASSSTSPISISNTNQSIDFKIAAEYLLGRRWLGICQQLHLEQRTIQFI